MCVIVPFLFFFFFLRNGKENFKFSKQKNDNRLIKKKKKKKETVGIVNAVISIVPLVINWHSTIRSNPQFECVEMN